MRAAAVLAEAAVTVAALLVVAVIAASRAASRYVLELKATALLSR